MTKTLDELEEWARLLRKENHPLAETMEEIAEGWRECSGKRRVGMVRFNANGGWYYASQDNWNRSGGFMIARVGPYVISDKAETNSGLGNLENARLIAAAPELLEAAQIIEERIAYYASLYEEDIPNIEEWGYTDNSGDMARLRWAIAKAKGEQE